MRRLQLKVLGFSLLETVIAMGMFGGLAVVATQQGISISQSGRSDATTGDYLELYEEITQLFSSSTACTQALKGSGSAPTIGAPVSLNDGMPPAAGTTLLTALYRSSDSALITAGQKFQKLLVTKIQIVPRTQPLMADVGGTASQYSQLFVTVVPDSTKPNQTQSMVFGLTTVKNSTSNIMISCMPPQPWTGSVLGLSKTCATDSALSWDGVGFTCKKIKCPLDSMQTGIDGNNIAVCTTIPTCSKSASASLPSQALIYRNGTFSCKGVLCPVGMVSNKKDSEGFIETCGPML